MTNKHRDAPEPDRRFKLTHYQPVTDNGIRTDGGTTIKFLGVQPIQTVRDS